MIYLALLFMLASQTAHATQSGDFQNCKSSPGETAAESRTRLSRQVLLAGLRYAREHSHPITGFVEDTVENYGENDAAKPSTGPVRASISSTGFMMALVADLYVKGMVTRDEAYSYCERPLTAVLKKQKADEAAAKLRASTGAPDPYLDISYEGWFSHFIDWSNGNRWFDAHSHKGVEYATTDSTWFLSGGIVCAETFPHSPISRKFEKIFSQVNFHAFMTDGETKKDKLTLSMAYTPDDTHGQAPEGSGYSRAQWQIYQHSWLVYLLGLGTPRAKFRLPLQAWSAWARTGVVLDLPGSELDGETLYGNKRALFSHYFPDVFMPPRKIHEACGIDYFRNSQIATRFNRETALGDTSSKTFQAGLWGLDAGPNPVPAKCVLGAPVAVALDSSTQYGVNSPYKRNGTACPACAVAAAMFEPELVFHDLRNWCDNESFGEKSGENTGPPTGSISTTDGFHPNRSPESSAPWP